MLLAAAYVIYFYAKMIFSLLTLGVVLFLFGSRIFTALLNLILPHLPYFLSVKVHVDVWEGVIAIQNLSLTGKAISNLLPSFIGIHGCSIGKVEINLPWRTLESEPARVTIEDVALSVAYLRSSGHCPVADYKIRQDKLYMVPVASEPLAPTQSPPPTGLKLKVLKFWEHKVKPLITKKVSLATDNLSVRVANVKVEYIDIPAALPGTSGHPFFPDGKSLAIVFGLSLNEVALQVVDQSGTPSFYVQREGSDEPLQRSISLDSLAISYQPQISGEPLGTRDARIHSILCPLSLQSTITSKRTRVPRSESQGLSPPENRVMETWAVVVNVTPVQLRLLAPVTDYLTDLAWWLETGCFRPPPLFTQPSSDAVTDFLPTTVPRATSPQRARSWWRYAIVLVIRALKVPRDDPEKPGVTIPNTPSKQRWQLRRQYIQGFQKYVLADSRNQVGRRESRSWLAPGISDACYFYSSTLCSLNPENSNTFYAQIRRSATVSKNVWERLQLAALGINGPTSTSVNLYFFGMYYSVQGSCFQQSFPVLKFSRDVEASEWMQTYQRNSLTFVGQHFSPENLRLFRAIAVAR